MRDDIIKQLDLKNSKIFLSSFNRPNLSYEILPKKDSLKSILAILNNYQNASVIIYCFSRNDTETMVNNLNKYGFKAAAYHAGLDSKKEKKIKNDLLKMKLILWLPLSLLAWELISPMCGLLFTTVCRNQ